MNPTAAVLIAQKAAAGGLPGPRLTPEQITAAIADAQYYHFPGTTVTVCCLTLLNGFNTIGESAAVSPENFDEMIGKRVAFDDAKRKIWALEGYLLKQELFEKTVAGA